MKAFYNTGSIVILLAVLSFSLNAQITLKTSDKESYGEKFKIENVMSYDQLYEKMKVEEEVVGQVKGTVLSVCQVKGCWMNISSESLGEDQSMFVKFKDYGFFMPFDLAGNEVIMNGKAFKEITSVDELRHYAEDEGKSEEEIEAIKEPKMELKFMADGVIWLKGSDQ